MAPERNRPSTWIRRAIGKLLPPATPQPEERESIWSINRKDAKTFFRLVSLLWIAGIAYTGHRARRDPTAEWNIPAGEPGGLWLQHIGDFVIATLGEFSGIAIGIAIIAMLLTRPVNIAGEILMSVYQAMVNRFVIPVIEAHEARGRAEGLEAGRVEGLEAGRIAERAKWQEWNRRRMDAEAQGRTFNEPPPSD